MWNSSVGKVESRLCLRCSWRCENVGQVYEVLEDLAVSWRAAGVKAEAMETELASGALWKVWKRGAAVSVFVGEGQVRMSVCSLTGV